MKPPPNSPEAKHRKRIIEGELLQLEADMEGIPLKELLFRKLQSVGRTARIGSHNHLPIWAVRTDELSA